MIGNGKIVVLMLGGARRVSMGELLIDSGKRLGYDVEIYSYELEECVPIATIGTVIIGRKWRDADVVEHLVETVKRLGVNIILPFVDGAIAIASECKKILPDVFIPVSKEDIATAMFDKALAARLFAEKEIAIPATYSVENCKFPAIAKPRLGSASKGIKVINNAKELLQLSNPAEYLIQEYIAHREEYTVDCYVSKEKKTMCVVPRLRIDIAGGEVTRTKTSKSTSLIDMSRKVLDKIPFEGPITLQFLHNLDNDEFMLMEINPRLGGGVVCSIHAGAPIADYIINEYLGNEIRECDDWKENTLMTRYQKEVIFYEA